MRRTAQRTMVYDTIVRLGGHCTAEELTEELHKTKPGFPRSTVYRALEALTASGSVYEAHLDEGHGFKPVRTEVLVVGVCDDCSRNPAPHPSRRRVIDPHHRH